MTRLIRAVNEGNYEKVIQYLKEGDDVNENNDNFTALYVASVKGDRNICQHLLENGADINVCIEEHASLWDAAYLGHDEIVKLLIQYKADIEIIDNSVPPLYIAIQENHFAVVKLLVDAGANVNFKDLHNESCLQKAIRTGNLAMVKYLIDHDADVQNETLEQITALHMAAFFNFPLIGKLLLDHGAPLNVRDHEGRTPLAMAAQYCPALVPLILDKNSEIELDPVDKFDGTPLFAAVMTQQLTIVRQLINRGADPYKTNFGVPIIQRALKFSSNIELFEILWSSQAHTKKLFELILQNKMTAIEDYLRETNFNEIELSVFFMFCINNKKSEIVQLIFPYLKQKNTLTDAKRFLKDFLPENKVHEIELQEQKRQEQGWMSKNLVFSPSVNEHQKRALQEAFAQIAGLFANHSTCISLLMQLDNTIAEKQGSLNYDYSTVLFEEAFVYDRLKWPKILSETFPQSYGLLRYLLKEQLAKYGIDTQDNMYTFVGFVEEEIANQKIIEGSLFKEQFLMGNAMYHSAYAHYLQWYIISRAVDEKLIRLDDGLTLLDVLKHTVQTTLNNKSSVWSNLLDYAVSPARIWYDLGCPSQLHNALLNCSELPHLRGMLLVDWYKKTVKILEFYRRELNLDISYESFVIAQHKAHDNFNMLNLGISTFMVDVYYQQHATTKGQLSTDTNILEKKNSVRFFKATQLFADKEDVPNLTPSKK
jgi:ankyrin repeat protein